jgi:hypothetical protein
MVERWLNDGRNSLAGGSQNGLWFAESGCHFCVLRLDLVDGLAVGGRFGLSTARSVSFLQRKAGRWRLPAGKKKFAGKTPANHTSNQVY